MVIDACDSKDASKVCEVLLGLIDALNFDYPEIAKSLLRLYEYCMDEVKSGNFDIPLNIFKETREPWV
ncbi:MAG: flagellar protein FliS [Candidatus Brocadiaceae bacterium]|nr:flagellar protein FliS [Candidatus Brocadiaceae bacterium]